MSCPYCAAPTTTEMRRRTTLGYRMFRCRACRRTCNERTGTPFNHLQVPTDIAVLVVLWRLPYKLSLRNVAEMFLTRGFSFTHETVREWEERFAPAAHCAPEGQAAWQSGPEVARGRDVREGGGAVVLPL